MTMPTFEIAGDAAVPAGEYVPAAVAAQLEQTLSKLVWTVLYGKALDASTLAVGAEQMLGEMKKAA
jgi:hypothetical protein